MKVQVISAMYKLKSLMTCVFLQASSLDVIKAAAKKFIDFVNNGPSPYHGMWYPSSFIVHNNYFFHSFGAANCC